MPFRFRDLSLEERKRICNGCGGKGHWFKPPSWLFQACCDHHDFNYWLGYREEDRARSDLQFYEAMLIDADASPWYLRWWRRRMAWAYWQAVKRWGGPFFYYGPKERTRTDLAAETDSAR